MAFSSIIEILKVGDIRSGVGKTGKPWQMQEAECILRDQDGGVVQVGVLDVPRDLIDNLRPGVYTASFTLSAHYQSRKIGAQLVALTPLPARAPVKPATSA
ncbi:hypothetical protein ACFIQG_10470 [Comamonas odontotermitis]|uniref:hypothetical protein n=1 Tax=Comamonas odontotermitis TaxID=379895 RepID=UPI00366E8501